MLTQSQRGEYWRAMRTPWRCRAPAARMASAAESSRCRTACDRVQRVIVLSACASALCIVSRNATAQATPTPPSPPAAHVTPTLSQSFVWRTRGEQWDWFGDDPAGAYAFVGTLLRAGLSGRHDRVAWTVEIGATLLLGLPDDAVAAAPQGQLGLGGTYAAANGGGGTAAGAFLKQAHVRFGAPASRGGQAMRAGRFEFMDGAELAPGNATLATIKRDRIAQRLVGNFGWSHAQRSLDGAHYSYTRSGPSPSDLTVVAAFPVEGVFRVDAWRPLDVGMLYGAYTRQFTTPAGSMDLRLFTLHSRDWRNIPPVDNRTAAVRASERGVTVTTFGGHWLFAAPTGVGTVDLLAWGALQTGRWGMLYHRADAAALEAGLQPPLLPGLRPWLRVGWFRGSGDQSATDGRHGTFFQHLPTPRPYARLPFFNLMNNEDLFAEMRLRPGARVVIRGDVRRLRLSEAGDLWYSGGGAFENAPSFGFAGRPGGGTRDLATLVDLSVEGRITPSIAVTLYGGRAAAGSVVRTLYGGSGPAWLGYLEVEARR